VQCSFFLVSLAVVTFFCVLPLAPNPNCCQCYVIFSLFPFTLTDFLSYHSGLFVPYNIPPPPLFLLFSFYVLSENDKVPPLLFSSFGLWPFSNPPSWMFSGSYGFIACFAFLDNAKKNCYHLSLSFFPRHKRCPLKVPVFSFDRSQQLNLSLPFFPSPPLIIRDADFLLLSL